MFYLFITLNEIFSSIHHKKIYLTLIVKRTQRTEQISYKFFLTILTINIEKYCYVFPATKFICYTEALRSYTPTNIHYKLIYVRQYTISYSLLYIISLRLYSKWKFRNKKKIYEAWRLFLNFLSLRVE